MNSTLTLNTTLAQDTATANTPVARPSRVTFSQVRRTVTHRWDMVAVIGLMVSSAFYGVYALTQMTGF